MEEVKKAIQDLQGGKSPQEDGLPAELYKVFFRSSDPKLLRIYKDALERGSLPDSKQTAIITLIHKKDRDPQQCGNYCPVSQINVDAKLLSKILASRLEGGGFYQNLFTQIKWVLLRIGHHRCSFFAGC